MTERVTWPTPPGSQELLSPFLRGERERPLRITFHEATLAKLPTLEREALDAVRQLAHRPDFEALTMPADQPLTISPGDGDSIRAVGDFEDSQGQLLYGDLPPRYDTLGILDQRGKRTGRLAFGWATAPRVCAQWATEIDGRSDLADPEVRVRLEDFIAARAHHACWHDILVTMSPWLLAHRVERWTPEAGPLARGAERWVAEANPRTPSEAARIVGLFLRARGDYTYWADGLTIRLDRGTFYWLLAHRRLPHMWRYRAACAEASKGSLRNNFPFSPQSPFFGRGGGIE